MKLKENKLRTLIRNEVKNLISENSITSTIGDGNNSTRWTPPGQKRRMNQPSLSGYKQVDYPEADNPVHDYPDEDLDDQEQLHVDRGIGAAFNNKIRVRRDDEGNLIFVHPSRTTGELEQNATI